MSKNGSRIVEIEPSLDLVLRPDPRGLGGLLALAEKAETPLPLDLVRVRARIAGDRCRTVIEQRFTNLLKTAVEAVHIFPLPEDGAVVEMELQAGDRIVRAECRAREEAEKIFEQAREAGHRAGLLTQERADVHTLRVTNLPAGTDVTVRIVVIERLESVDGLMRWRFPTVIPPRYLPGTPTGHDGPGVLPRTDHVPDTDRLQPPLLLNGGTRLDLEVSLDGPIHQLESSLHAVRMQLDAGGARVAPAPGSSLDRDFVLAFASANETEPGLRAWTDGEYTLAVLEPPQIETEARLARDAVFVIDTSGSMSGIKLEAAKRALKGAMHGLEAGDRFKLIRFSSDHSSFDAEFKAYTEQTLHQADQWIARLQADGGTEMLPAVREALAGDAEAGRSRTVLFITDGQAWNERELTAAVAHRRGDTTFFTMGIDTAVNSSLLNQLARAGGGTCELLTPYDDIEAAVTRLESRLGGPLATEVRLTGGQPAHEAPMALFAGRAISRMLAGSPKIVRAKGKTAGGELSLQSKPVRIDFPLDALWARERVAALEDRLTLRPFEEEAIRPEILRIALEHRIASRFTAFVAVDSSVNEKGERVEIVQPAELPLGWAPPHEMVPMAMVARSAPRADYSIGSWMSAEADLYHFKAMPEELHADEWPTELRASMRVRPELELAIALGLRDEASLRSETRRHLVELGFRASRQAADDLYDRIAQELRSQAFAVLKRAGAKVLAQEQSADGSFGDDARRTAAALIVLVLLGTTRKKGSQKRTLVKAYSWLKEDQTSEATLALAVLQEAESGAAVEELLTKHRTEIGSLGDAGPEGQILGHVIKQLQAES